MKTTKSSNNIIRGLAVMLLISLFTVLGISQNVVVSSGGTFGGAGTYNIKGNINTSGAGGAVSFSGTVNLNGTTQQQLGVSGSNGLTFATLNAVGTSIKQADVSVAVTDALTVNSGQNLDIQANTLTLSGTSTLTSGSVDVSDAGSTVVFNQTGGGQVALGLTYAGALTLSGTSTKTFSAAGSVAGAFSHSGGDLTVNQDLTVSSATPSFATIADVSATKTLTLSGTGAKSITAVTSTNATGTIDHTGASGLLTIATLTNNLGTINAGAGGVTFTNGATNNGAINGGAGAVTFSSTLAQSAGTITAGSGDIAFGGVVTIDGGTITSGSAGNVLDFNANIVNTAAANITLTGAGEATINGSVNPTGLSFASGSLVTFDGGAQTVPGVTFGNLTIAGSAAKTSGANIGVAGNLSLSQDLDMFSGSDVLTFANAASTVSGAGEVIGSVSRTHTFVGATSYAFNRAEVLATFDSNEPADMTITMRPSVAPTGVGADYVNRFYGVSSSADLTTNNMDLQLYYTDAERVGTAVTAETKMGIRNYNGSTLSKYGTNGGSYTRSVGGDPNTVALTNLNVGLTGIQEFALLPITYETVSSGAWATTATWGSTPDDVPTATDNAEVRHDVSVGAAATIAGLTITDDATFAGKLNVSGANFNATTITNNGGEITVAATRTLTVSGALTNNTGTTSADLITVSGIATLASVANNTTFTVATGGVANLTGAFANNSGSTLNTVGTGALTVTGADLTNAGTINNAGTITVE